MMDWGYMGAGGWAMVVVWGFGLLLVVGAVAAVVVLAVPRNQPPADVNGRVTPASPAEAALELRYARGEIDVATFVEARSVLRQR
jgi:uncharacterized membrane protein